jgi:Rrf2 family protein
MQLTYTAEYAIRAMLHLSSIPLGSVANIATISREWSIPEAFLRKIIAQLSKAGLISSQRGLGGGVQLAKDPAALTLLDIVEAVEGKITLNKCLVSDDACPRAEWCSVHTIWGEAQEALKSVLRRENLATIAADSLAHRERIRMASPVEGVK